MIAQSCISVISPAVLAACSIFLSAQMPSTNAKTSERSETRLPVRHGALEVPVPEVSVQFEQTGPIPGAHGSQAFVSPIVCSPDGIPFVAFIEPADFGPQSIFSLDPKGGRLFSLKSIPGLYDINFIHGYFVSESNVGILVNGTKDEKRAPNTIKIGPSLPPKPVYTGEHHDYLVRFDRDAIYKDVIELPSAYSFRRLAPLPDGSVLALAYDRANRVVRLLVFDVGGSSFQKLSIPEQIENDPIIRQGQSGGDTEGAMQAESSLSAWHIATVRNRALLYISGSTLPLIEVGAGGAVREVSIDYPNGFKLDEVIPASDRWLLRMRKDDSLNGAANQAQPTREYAVFEVNPSDGSLLRRINVGTASLFSVTCETDGKLSAFSVDGDKVIKESTDLH